MGIEFKSSARDYRGYGDKPPAVRWPNGARLALSIVVNFEEGAELSLTREDERNEYVYEIVERIEGVPDACMESHFAYGMRAGWPRIRALLRCYGVRATINACGRAVEISPWLAATTPPLVYRFPPASVHGGAGARRARAGRGPSAAARGRAAPSPAGRSRGRAR